MPYPRFFQLCCCVLGLAGSSAAQSPDTLPRVQLSYGFHVWHPNGYGPAGAKPEFVRDDPAPGVSLDLEARLGRTFSMLATLGTEVERGRVSFGDLPIAPAGGQLPEVDLIFRRVAPVERQYRRYYAGLGLQGNLRIGRGDLSLGAVGTFGVLRLHDVVSLGDVEPVYVRPDSQFVRPPLGLPYSATLQYTAVWQTGGRAHLAYTFWVDRRLALRAGAYVGVRGGFTAGSRGVSPARFVVREVTYSADYRPEEHNYSLPDESRFTHGDPTAAVWQRGFTVGMIYKPR
ncbi:hypothetical protein [Lewinella sp. IMCC34183]|uniref:hypothetical protein n=1 Tax=Lewinella sp. IMCC34183 TaxID=2248762 RepID=UPI0013002483|nr:hypothetical protein [Lewinella sp. IMCC34183]